MTVVKLPKVESTVEILLYPEYQTEYSVFFYQPIRVRQSDFDTSSLFTFKYRIPMMDRRIENPEAAQTENKTTMKKVKVKKKKRRSTTFSRIEELLTRGKDILLLPEPSEESLYVEVDVDEEKKVQQRDITHLSDDVLQSIFWYFNMRERCTILSRVCKTWYYILKNPIFWTKLEFDSNKVQTKVIIQLIKSSPQLKSLKLTAVPEAPIILQELCREKTGITELAIRYCTMSRIDGIHVLLQMLSAFPNLEVLDLKGTEFRSRRFFTELCTMKRLKSLDLGANKYLQPRDLLTVSLNCHSLETLKILNVPSNMGTKDRLSDENFSFMIGNLRDNLRTLKYDMQHLGNSAFQPILNCQNLTCLHLSNCLFLTGDMFRRFDQLTNLKSFTVTKAINISSDDLRELFSGDKLHNIEHLNLNGSWKIDNAALKAISIALPLLKSLFLEQCTLIKGSDLNHLSRCNELTILNISRTSIQPHELNIVGSSARKLKLLVIHSSTYDERAVRDLKKSLPSAKIEVIEGEYAPDKDD